MVRLIPWPAVLVAAALIAACGGSDTNNAAQATVTSTSVTASATVAGPARPAATATATPITDEQWKKLAFAIPTDDKLPDRVTYQMAVDLSNDAAADGDVALLKLFRDSGRQNGIQFFFSIEAGTRTVSVGVSYYNNPDSPKKLLRNSGDPSSPVVPPRFEVSGLGDEYLAQRVKLGAGESAAQVINIAWVRGTYFISLADLGVAEGTANDIAIKLATAIDEQLRANPKP